jgi:predicted TIM-barrel fold metal-dependent hydrolase
LRDAIPNLRRDLGNDHLLTMKARGMFAETLIMSKNVSVSDVRLAVTILEDTAKRSRRVFGASHEEAQTHQSKLESAKAALAWGLDHQGDK